MSEVTLQGRVAELAAQHGSLRAAARVLMVSAPYLHRIASGEKTNPDDLLLRRMGLSKVVTYVRREAPEGSSNG